MNPTQNPSALRSKKIITETLITLLKDYPLSEITVKHILLESGISRKTFYRNFSSKEDVLSSYIDSILFEYKDKIIDDSNITFTESFDIIFNFCAVNKELLIILKNNNLLYLPLMKLNTLLPTLHKDIDNRSYLIYFNIGGIWNIIVNWINNDMLDSADKIKRNLIDYLSDINNISLCDL